MPEYIDPNAFDGLPLDLHWLFDRDYAVRIGDYVAGRIMRREASGGRETWFWTVTGPYLPAELRPSHGEAETLLEAKAAFRAKFDAWLAWAKELGHRVAWLG